MCHAGELETTGNDAVVGTRTVRFSTNSKRGLESKPQAVKARDEGLVSDDMPGTDIQETSRRTTL